MHRWLRNTHLVVGLFCFLFVLMYGVSSVELAHRSWFHSEPRITKLQIPISPESAVTARAVARELMDRHGFAGEIREGQPWPEGYRFSIARPGLGHAVRYSRATGVAEIDKRDFGFIGKLVRIHETASLNHNDWVANAWGAFTGIVSAGLILMALTGIYLWFKIHAERAIGAALLIVSLGYSLTVMILLRAA